jgi:hypothetical protein
MSFLWQLAVPALHCVSAESLLMAPYCISTAVLSAENILHASTGACRIICKSADKLNCINLSAHGIWAKLRYSSPLDIIR